MDIDKWEFNLTKLSQTKRAEREMVVDMFNEMLIMYNSSYDRGVAKSRVPDTSRYKTAMMMFNTLLSNGWLISKREKTLGEVLDNNDDEQK